MKKTGLTTLFFNDSSFCEYEFHTQISFITVKKVLCVYQERRPPTLANVFCESFSQKLTNHDTNLDESLSTHCSHFARVSLFHQFSSLFVNSV